MVRRLPFLALFVFSAICFVARSPGSPAPAAAGASSARDVVLVTIDTLRYDAVGFDGNSKGTTPNLDRFAGEGRVFSSAHAHNVLTLPSHTNILTGLYPYQHGVRDNAGFRLSRNVETAATMLKRRGFATGAFVSAFILDSRYGLARGFDVYDEIYRHVDNPEAFDIAQGRGDAIVSAALAWYRRPAAGPRFLWIHLYDPHAPYDPPEAYRTRLGGDAYLGEVAFADSSLAPLLDAVRARRPAPLLVVTSDHGEARGDHGELTHGLFAYEPTLHVPLFLWSPGLVASGRDSRPARHVDILPTILAAAGAPVPRSLPGVSLLGAPSASDLSYFESLSSSFNRGWAPLRGLLGEGHKYVELPVPELYDLRADPAESRNLVSSAPDALRRLRKRLLETPAGPVEPGAVASEEAAKLRSLGYLSGGGDRKSSYGPADDPKNLIEVDRQLHRLVELYETGHPEGALRIARDLVAARPKMKLGYQHLAFLLQEKGDLAGAIRVYEEAAAHGAGGESIDRSRALALCETGRPREAIALLTPYRDGADTETLNALGVALSDSGRGPEALAMFGKVLELDPRNAMAFQNAGIAFLKLDRAAQARESLEKGLAIHERNPRAWNALGVARMRLDQPAKAIEAWSRCLAYNPKQYDALYNLGLVAARTGDRARAKEALKRFLEIAPPAQYAKDLAEVRDALTRLERGS